MTSPSIRWVLVLLLGSLLHACRPAAEELVLGHFMGTNHPMHRDVFLPLADTLVRLSGGELTLRIVPDLTNSTAQYARAVSGELDLAFGLPGYTKDRFPRTQLIELPDIVEGAQEATRVLGRSLDLVLKTEYPDVVVLSLWVNEAAVLLCRDRTVRSLEDFSGLRVRAADAQSARILTLMGATPVVIPADGILSAFQAREIEAALMGASGVLPFRLQTVSKSCTVGFPSLFTGFFLVMNRQRWSSLSQVSRGWLMESTGPGLGAVATAAYERSAQKGLEALAAAGVSVVELPVSEAARLKDLTGVVHEDVLGSLAAKGIDGRPVLDCYRPRVEPSVVETTVEVRIFGAPGVRYRLENSSDLVRWQMAADVVIDHVSIPIRFRDPDSGIRSFFRSTEVLPGTMGRAGSPDHF